MLGIQMFGCAKLFRADPEGFLRKAREMGYTSLEPCILPEEREVPFAWNSREAGHFADLVKAQGLTIDSFHLFSPDPFADPDRVIRTARSVGARAVVLGVRCGYDEGSAAEYAQRCAGLADALKEHGLELWLHNGAPDIAARIGDVSVYEYILRLCGGRVGAQVDTGWAVCGGEELAAFLERNEAYIRCIHHKDVAAVPGPGEAPDCVPPRLGIVDDAAACRFALAKGLPQVVDQDNARGDLYDDMKEFAEYLTLIGG